MFSGLSAAQPSARRWTALASFTLQAAVIAAALVLPMFYPQSLPQAYLARQIFVPMSNGEVRAATTTVARHSGGPSLSHPILVSRDLRVPRFDSALPVDNQPPGPEPAIEVGDPRSTIATLISGPSL